MIKNLIDLLGVDNFYGVSENVDIAKGKYQKPRTLGDCKDLIVRMYYGR